MNNFFAKAHVKETRIVYTYEYEGNSYEIETPRTPLNAGVEDGEVVQVMLGIMATEEKMKGVKDDAS